jgi:hypothetical protein
MWAGPNGVCVIPDIALLPPATAAGIILHEVGHVMSNDRSDSGAEPMADDWVRVKLGIDILYSPKAELQYLARPDMAKLGL